MEVNYILYIIIVGFAFVLLKKIAKIYISQSQGNSIKTEESLMLQAYLTLIMGLLMIFSIYISNSLEGIVLEVIFYGEGILCLLNVVIFLSILYKQITDYTYNKKGGSIWLIILSHFIKNIVFIYFLYSYYVIFI